MHSYRFEMPVALAPDVAPRIDRDAGIIRGVQVLALGEAKGHDLIVDEVMLQQAATLINATGEAGLKSRFAHPGQCTDGTGRMLGRLRNASVVDGRTIADLHLADFASKSPDGNLAGYVLDMAEEDPSACGLSIAFEGTSIWKMPDGSSVAARRGEAAPQGAIGTMPFARISKLRACDFVDEPAVTSGLFAAAFSGTTSADAAEAFAALDQLCADRGISLAQARAFTDRYFAARGHTPKESPMRITLALFAAMLAANPEITAELNAFAQDPANAEADEAAYKAKIVELKSAAAQRDVAALRAKLAEKETAHQAALAAKDAEMAALKAKNAQITALGEGAPKDVGSVPAGAGTGDPIAAKWSAMSPAEQVGFFNDIEVYREAERLRARDLAAAGKQA